MATRSSEVVLRRLVERSDNSARLPASLRHAADDDADAARAAREGAELLRRVAEAGNNLWFHTPRAAKLAGARRKAWTNWKKWLNCWKKRDDPDDVLRRVLDVAGLAVHAVLRVDLQAVVAVVVLHELVDAGRAVAARGRRTGQVDATGTAASFSVRCAGWFSSWLVLLMNTCSGGRRSACRPAWGSRSGALGGRFEVHVVGLSRCSVQGGAVPSGGSSHCSMPVISVPMVRPFLNHCLKLRARSSSVVQPALLEGFGEALSSSCWRPARAASKAASAASMPVLMAAWLPLMRLALR